MVMRARRAGRVDAALLLSSLCATAIASEAPHNPYAPPRPAQGGAAGGYAAGGYAAGGYAGGYDENLWDVPPPPDAVAVLRPFRIATRGSAAFTFGLAAFRATSLADRARLLQLGPLGALAKPSFGLNAAAAALVAADRAPKVAAKALLYGNVVLEAMAGAGSLARAAFPTSGQLLPADAHLANQPSGIDGPRPWRCYGRCLSEFDRVRRSTASCLFGSA